MKLLITFGCSWTYGVSVNYVDGMSRSQYMSGAWNEDICNQYSFRGLLSARNNFTNINFAVGGSSNQTQFRLAEEFFSSLRFQQCQDQFDEIVVLWAITSVYRNEIFNNKKNARASFLYSDNSFLSKTILTENFNHNEEIARLAFKIKFWNTFFKKFGIKNFWVDTFNHHDYLNSFTDQIEKYQRLSGGDWPSWEKFVIGNFENTKDSIVDEIMDTSRWNLSNYCFKDWDKSFFGANDVPRDLLSKLAILNGCNDIDNNYHESDWVDDSNRIRVLVDKKILNPISYHPTKLGHEKIADMLSELF